MANYLIEMRLAEELVFAEIRFIRSALKQGRAVIGYLSPEGAAVDKRMGPQKFQFLSIDDLSAEIIWLPPSRDGKPYSAEEIPDIPQSDKALLTSDDYENINEPQVVAEARYSLKDLQVVDPTDDSWDDESGILARRAWKRKSRDVEEAYEIGTDEYRKHATDITPCQKYKKENKAYYKGLSKSTADKRKSAFKAGAKKDSDDASAYPDSHPGDARAKTRTSKYTKAYHKKFGESTLDEAIDEKAKKALQKKAEKSGITYGILKQVYNRGLAAWRTGHRPGANQQQWGYARVNSFITGGKTRSTADKDLWQKHKGKKESVQEGENHSWKSTGHYTADGEEWLGPQHAHNGQVMTGEKHTDDSVNLYHFKDLAPEIQKKVLSQMNEHGGHDFQPGDAVTIPDKDLSGVVLSQEKDDLYKIQLDGSDKITMAYADNMRWVGPMRYESLEFDGVEKLQEAKTIKVGEDSIGAGSTAYALVKERKILALGEKEEMLQRCESDGGRVWVVSGERAVGDLVESLAGLHAGRVKQIRYERAHGKPAKGKGQWSFSVNRYSGDDDKDDVVFVRGTHTVADAANLAVDEFKKRGKKIAKSDLYVMESIEEESELDGVESDGEAEEMLARIKSRAADRKDSESFDRPESESKTRPATKRVLQHRAIRLARNLVFKKESGGKAKSELLFPERLRIEKIVASQKDVVMDLARQLYPIINQKEQDRNKPI